jgi:hypothetical protein
VTDLDEYLWFVDDCLGAMLAIVEELGDDLANRRLDVPGANSPYAILTHCLGMMNHWGGDSIAGRDVVRDRNAEFVAVGPVAGMGEAVRRARDRFAEDLTRLDPAAAPLDAADLAGEDVPFARTQSAVLLHVFHELAQHLGQMEVTRDVLRAGPAADPAP